MPGVAIAQEAATADQIGQPAKQITVTGSQIRQDTSSNTPMTVITSKQLQDSNTVTLAQYLAKIPSFGQQGVSSNQNAGGEGVSFVELRNLGVTRTLVLIDGHRMVASGTNTVNAVDLNNIPVSTIDHIEILRDGASAVYGSDAIAGVVNVILIKYFALIAKPVAICDAARLRVGEVGHGFIDIRDLVRWHSAPGRVAASFCVAGACAGGG